MPSVGSISCRSVHCTHSVKGLDDVSKPSDKCSTLVIFTNGRRYYLTITRLSEGLYKEKMSKFISFAIPVSTLGEVKEAIARYQKEYYDARHVCWAYMLGHARTEFRANDNGEPSGTAGKPILGQINSFGLTDVLIVVVRYFGGIKLGTSGLIEAYRAAAADAIRANEIVERLVEDDIRILFEYRL